MPSMLRATALAALATTASAAICAVQDFAPTATACIDDATSESKTNCCTEVLALMNAGCLCDAELKPAAEEFLMGKITTDCAWDFTNETDCGFDFDDMEVVPVEEKDVSESEASEEVALSMYFDTDISNIDQTVLDAIKNDLAAQFGVDAANIIIADIFEGSAIIDARIQAPSGQELDAATVNAIENAAANGDLQLDSLPTEISDSFRNAGVMVDTAALPPPGPGNGPSISWTTPEVAKLGPAKTMLPRLNVLGGFSEYTGVFDIMNLDYIYSCIIQGVPGIAVGAVLLVVEILMLVIYLLSGVFGQCCCKCCNNCFKPRRFTKRSVRISQFMLLVGVAIAAGGCISIYSSAPSISGGIDSLLDTLVANVESLDQDLTQISQAMSDASAHMDGLPETDNMDGAIDQVNDLVNDNKKLIDQYLGLVNTLFVGIAGALGGICLLGAIFGILGWWKVLLLIVILASILMVVCWIVYGVVSIVVTVLDDLCTAISVYSDAPEESSLSSLIPCIDAKTSTELMNVARQMLAESIGEVNKVLYDNIGMYDKNMPYLCTLYTGKPIEEVCNPEGRFDGLYERFVCTADRDDATFASDFPTVYPKADCPFPTAAYANQLGDFQLSKADGGFAEWRCQYSMEDSTDFEKAMCFSNFQIPYDEFDKQADMGAAAQLVVDVLPVVEKLITCEFVTNAMGDIAAENGPCLKLNDGIWKIMIGFLLTAVAYLVLWVNWIVIITRCRNPQFNDSAKMSA